MISFELKNGGRDEVFRFMDGLQMIVRARGRAMCIP